jgi:hypothetical protein
LLVLGAPFLTWVHVVLLGNLTLFNLISTAHSAVIWALLPMGFAVAALVLQSRTMSIIAALAAGAIDGILLVALLHDVRDAYGLAQVGIGPWVGVGGAVVMLVGGIRLGNKSTWYAPAPPSEVRQDQALDAHPSTPGRLRRRGWVVIAALIAGTAALGVVGIVESRRSSPQEQASTCTIYETNTDVSLTLTGAGAENACGQELSSLPSTTNNSWSYTQIGNNYPPADASTVCTLTLSGLTYTVADSGGQIYGNDLCNAMNSASTNTG